MQVISGPADQNQWAHWRRCVVAMAAAGESCRKGLYKISVASVVKWSQRYRATGSAAAKRMGI